MAPLLPQFGGEPLRVTVHQEMGDVTGEVTDLLEAGGTIERDDHVQAA
jgi:hypothetical protein